MTTRALVPALVGALVVSAASCASAQGTKEAPPVQPPAAAVPSPPPSQSKERPNEVLVRFKEGTTDAQRAETHALIKGARTVRRFTSVSGLEQIALPAGITVDEALAIYRKSPHVQYAEPNRTVQIAPADETRPPAPLPPK